MGKVKKQKRGPTKYRPEYAEEAMHVCAGSGATTEGLAEHFGVCDRTVRNWKRRHKGFGRAVERGLRRFRKKYPAERREGGRESLYEDGYAEIARDLVSTGADVRRVAETLRVSPRTIYHWLKTRPEFKEAVDDGHRWFAHEVEGHLLNQALPHDEVVERETRHGLVRITKKNVVNEKALIRILETYFPEQWGRKVQSRSDGGLAEFMRKIEEQDRESAGIDL